MEDQSPTSSIERGKRQRRRLQDSRVLNSNPSSSNEQFHNTSDIGASNTSSSQQQSNQGDDDSIGVPRFPIGILGGRGGGTAASTAWVLSGPWLQLCSRLNLPIPTLSMKGKGNDDTLQLAENWMQLYFSTFRCTISDIEMGKWDLRVPFVAGVLRKIRKPREKDLVAQLVDPTGSIECFLQEGALVKYGADIGVGSAVLAKGVAVWLSNTPGLCRNLCLHKDAIQVVWPPDTPRPGEEELIRLQGLSKTTMPIDVTLDSLLSPHQQNNTTNTISRVVEGDGGNEAATEAVPLEIIPLLEMGLQEKTSEEDGDEDFITTEAFKVEKMPSWNVLAPQSYIEQNTTSPNINVHHHPSPASASDLHIKREETNTKSDEYSPLSGTPPPFNRSVTTTTSSNPSPPTLVVGLQKLNNPSQQPPPSRHFESSSAAQSLHCKGGNNSNTTRCDVEETTTTLIQKEGGGTLFQNMSMVEKSEVSLHDEIKKTNTTTNTEEETPPPPKNPIGGSSKNNSTTSFGSDWSSVNSVQKKKQQLGPTSIMRGWGEALSEQNLFEAVLNDSDDE